MNWGFVGCGNLAQAVISGAVKLGALTPFNVIACDVDREKLKKYSKEVAFTIADDIRSVVEKAEIIVLAMKPQDIVPVLKALGNADFAAGTENKAIVSLAAGVSSKLLLRHLKAYGGVTRVMANTPALVQRGLFGIFPAKKKQEHDLEILRIFSTLGEVVPLKNDEQVNALTSGSASGVGFVFSFIEVFENWCIKKGFTPAEARKIAVETFLGTALLAKQRGESLAQLREAVTSKKGTTLAGLIAMKKAKVDAGLKSGLDAGYSRAVEITKDLLRGEK